MTIHGRWHGIDQQKLALDFMVARIDAASRDSTEKVLKQVARQEKTLLSLGWHPPGTPTGSVSPDPPWRISRHLRSEVKTDGPHPSGPHGWWGRVGSTAIYARIQELGGVTGRGHRTRLPPRPHLKPAWAIVRPTVRRTFMRAWAAAVRR